MVNWVWVRALKQECQKYRNDSAEILRHSAQNQSAKKMKAPKRLALFPLFYYQKFFQSFYYLNDLDYQIFRSYDEGFFLGVLMSN